MRSSAALLAVLCLGLASCTVGARSGRRMVTTFNPYAGGPSGGPACPEPEAAKPNPDRIPGTASFRVVWEALYVERYRSDHSKFKRVDGSDDPALGRIVGTPEFEVILLNTSFVPTAEQDRDNKSTPPSGRIARATDRNMLDLITALERLGFFRYAQPTGSIKALFGSENARGRITVERDGASVTLLSQRGLGLQDDTKEIPQIYADAKEAIRRLKNLSPGLRVKGTSVEPTDLRHAKSGTPPASGATGGTGGTAGNGK